MKYLVLALAGALLASCSNVPVEVGSGPIKLSDKAQAAYDKYASSRSPIVFVATEDGQHFQYNYCVDARCRKGGGSARAIAECQYLSDGKRCYVYDRTGQIVWDREKDFRGDEGES